MDIVKTAEALARTEHENTRLRYVNDSYFSHVETVASNGRTDEEKVLGYLHDVAEEYVKRKLGKNPDAVEEKSLIHASLRGIEKHFKTCGYDITHLTPALDVLTRRVTDKTYSDYIERIVAYARTTGDVAPVFVKKADLRNNMDPARNPPLHEQTPEDRARLENYEQALGWLTEAFPNRPSPKQENNPPPLRLVA